jgi:hypothetical protein
MLEPILGETGALIAQFVITLAVVLLLLLVVVWLVRRYSRAGVSAAGRGRLPRLAIVDAMAVDNRRKLVLVRRDNVEHLILIGGPSDLVVEPGIMRQRAAAGQRQAAAQAAAAQQGAVAQPAAAAPTPAAAQPVSPAEPEQPMPAQRPTAAPAVAPPPAPPAPAAARARAEPVGADQPIPFPPRRSPLAGRGWLRRDAARQASELQEPEEPRAPRPLTAMAAAGIDLETARPSRPLAASARFEEMTRPTAIQPSFSLINEDETEPELPPPLDPEEPETIAAGPREAARDIAAALVGAEPEEGESTRHAEPHAAIPVAADEASEQPETSVKVSDLEKEMARLLGEISTSRSS